MPVPFNFKNCLKYQLIIKYQINSHPIDFKIVPKNGTIVLMMSTGNNPYKLFGKTRSVLLALFYRSNEKSFYLREIIRITGIAPGAVQRELVNLLNMELITRHRDGNQVYFQANGASPIFSEIKSLMIKTFGLADILRSSLKPIKKQVKVAFIYGSIARGSEKSSSDVDVLVVGEVTFSKVSDLLGAAQQKLDREVNPSVYPEKEFIKKIFEGHHFLNEVIQSPKIMLIGDENDLAKLVKKRLVD